MGGLSFRVRQNATQSSVPVGTVAEIFRAITGDCRLAAPKILSGEES